MEEQKFEPYQKVLARFRKGEPWTAVFYSHKGKRGHLCGCYYYDDCIPYEGNEHLVGTTDDPKPKWEPKLGELVAAFDYRGGRVHALTFSRRVEVDGTTRYLTKEPWQSVETLWNFCEPLRKHFNIPDEGVAE